MFAVNPGVLAAGARGKTYEDWLAHISTRTSLVSASNHYIGNSGYDALVRFTAGTATSHTGWGSPWRSQYGRGYAGHLRGALLHSLPSAAIYQEQRTREVLLKVITVGEYSSLASQTRNGWTSGSITQAENGGAPIIGASFTEVSYWDVGLNKPLTMNPYASVNQGPHDYAHPDWSPQ